MGTFQVAPQLVGAQQQRNVGGIFEISLPNDPRLAVARSPVMRGRELLEAQDAVTARGEMKCRRAAHAAQPQDNRVERSSHVRH